jgi:hypothetical protein
VVGSLGWDLVYDFLMLCGLVGLCECLLGFWPGAVDVLEEVGGR